MEVARLFDLNKNATSNKCGMQLPATGTTYNSSLCLMQRYHLER